MILKFRLWYVLGITLFLLSCAVRTPVKQVSVDEVMGNLKYKNIIFRKFDAAPGVHPNSAIALVFCKETAISHLKGKAVFQKVEDSVENSYDEPTLFVDVTLTDLRIVSGAARFWGGALAGRSHMKIFVKLIDATSGALITEKELFGAPNAYGSAYSFGSSDRNLAGNMGILLGDFIFGNVSGK